MTEAEQEQEDKTTLKAQVPHPWSGSIRLDTEPVMNFRLVETATDGSEVVWTGQLHREMPEERTAYEAEQARQAEMRSLWDDISTDD